jgi:phage baseplate assembly protein W
LLPSSLPLSGPGPGVSSRSRFPSPPGPCQNPPTARSPPLAGLLRTHPRPQIPTSNRLSAPNPDAYIEQLIRQVILTAPGERIHRPDFGGGLQRQVFALNSFATAVIAEPIVYQALDRWLGGLIRVEKVEATAQDATMLVAITYVVLQRGVRRYLNLEVGA